MTGLDLDSGHTFEAWYEDTVPTPGGSPPDGTWRVQAPGVLLFEAPASGQPDQRAVYEYRLEDEALTLSLVEDSGTGGAWLTKQADVGLRRVPPLEPRMPPFEAMLALIVVASSVIAMGVVGWKRRRGYYAFWAAAYCLTITGFVAAFPIGRASALSVAAAACLAAGFVDWRWHAKGPAAMRYEPSRGTAQVLVAAAAGAAGFAALVHLWAWDLRSWFPLVVLVLGVVAVVAHRTDNPGMALRASVLLGILGIAWLEGHDWLVGLSLVLSAGLHAGATWVARRSRGPGDAPARDNRTPRAV